MDKLVFPVIRRTKKSGQSPVTRITREAYDKCAEISASCGYSISYIASEMIIFASRYVEFKELYAPEDEE